MTRMVSPEQQARNQRVDAIVELFRAGYTVDYACEQGVAGGWTRADVLAVVEQRGWPLDGSGRLPLRMRRTPARLAELRPPRRRLVDAALPPTLEAIARYDETPRAAAVAPPAAAQAPAAPEPPARPRQPATSPTDVSEAVERFLAERTVPAPDDQYLTAPDLRDAYEAWRAEAGAPAVTPRWLGIVLTAKFRKKQAVTKINGVKPNCYYGVAWKQAKPTETPTEGAAPTSSDVHAAGTAPDPSGSGHGYAGPDAQPQVSPSRSHAGEGGGVGASEALAEPPAAGVEPLADWEVELARDWEWDPISQSYVQREASEPVAKADKPLAEASPPRPVDLLTVGLAHAHPAVRAKAKRVQSAVDDLCAALARHSGAGR